MVVQVWKCRSRPPVHALQQVPEERRNVVNVEVGIVLAGDDEQVLRQRQLPLAEDGVGAGEQLLRPALLGIGNVALAADGQQQRMHAGRIDGVNRVHAGHHRRDDRAGQFVDDLAEAGVLLRRPADDGERPDRRRRGDRRARRSAPGKSWARL